MKANAPIPIIKPVRGAGKVAFWARKDAIAKKIEEGYPLIMIYEEYQRLLPIGYGQFLIYVRRYLRSKSEEPEAEQEKEQEEDYLYDDVHFTLQIHGVVRIGSSMGATAGKDIQINTNLTLDEINGSPDLGIISKSGLFQIEQIIYDRLSSRFKELGHD